MKICPTSFGEPDFVEDMLIKYADYLPADVKVTLPFEPGTVLGVNEPDYDPSPAEQDEYRAMGALSLAGQLLWLARRAYNVILFSVTQLCAVMSKPSKRMWDAGIRILMWLRDYKASGSTVTAALSRAYSMTLVITNIRLIRRFITATLLYSPVAP